MIEFHHETDFTLSNPGSFEAWLMKVIESEEKIAGDINYIFCDDEYLLKVNLEYLNHDTYTDIITFDYCEGNFLHGDVFISVERVAENAVTYGVDFSQELLRVMSHGILHLCGYKDKSAEDERLMRSKEDEKISMFHVEHGK
jgi:probable rRNA maturation factor